MAFRASDGSFLGEWYARKQEEFYSHVPVWVAVGAVACEATGRYLTHAEYHGLIELLGGMNSYTRKVLLPVLDDLAVCELASYCMSQSGRELGDLDLPRHYNEAVEKELAPLLGKRLRVASAGWIRLDGHFEKVRAALEPTEEDECLPVLPLAKKRAAQLNSARREAAAWEVQCQDLRDKLVQLQNDLAAQRKMGAKLADYLDTANGIIEEEGGDEEDIRDARELVVEARALFGGLKSEPVVGTEEERARALGLEDGLRKTWAQVFHRVGSDYNPPLCQIYGKAYDEGAKQRAANPPNTFCPYPDLHSADCNCQGDGGPR